MPEAPVIAAEAAPVVAPPQGTVVPPVVQTPAPLLYDKWKTPEEADKGIAEGLKFRGIEVDPAKMYGEGGMFTNRDAAAKVYKSVMGSKPVGDVSEVGTIDDLVKASGLDPMALGTKWAQKQTLDDDDYSKLGNLSFTDPATGKVVKLNKAAVNEFIGGRYEQAKINAERAAEIHAQVHNENLRIAGGTQAQLDQLLLDAKEYPAHLKDDVNRRLKDPLTQNGAIRELKAWRDEKTGVRAAGTPVTGTMPAPARGIETADELLEVMKQRRAGSATAEARWNATPTAKLKELQSPPKR